MVDGSFGGPAIAASETWMYRRAMVGDLNCDGRVDFGDIDPFVLALDSELSCTPAYPRCNWRLADVNGDGRVDGADIIPFVALLSGGP